MRRFMAVASSATLCILALVALSSCTVTPNMTSTDAPVTTAAAKCTDIGDIMSGSFDVVPSDQTTVTITTTGYASLSMVVYTTS